MDPETGNLVNVGAHDDNDEEAMTTALDTFNLQLHLMDTDRTADRSTCKGKNKKSPTIITIMMSTEPPRGGWMI
jgi:hypothetical protein